MSERAPYSRVYHSIVDDPKFTAIFDSDRRLATWLRLLIVAEQAHPASANIPAGTNRAAVAVLVDAGLIDLGTGSRYRIHGLDAERTRRSEAARVGGLASGRSRSVEPSFNGRSTKSNLDKTSIDKTSNTRAMRKPFADPLLEQIRTAQVATYGEEQSTVPTRLPTAAEQERETHRLEALALHERFQRGELGPAEYERLLADVGKPDDDLTRLHA